MADHSLRTDLHTPQPNKLLDAYRQEILAALEKTKLNATGVDDNYWLVDLAFSLLDGALADVLALRADLEALTARVATLEAPPAAPS